MYYTKSTNIKKTTEGGKKMNSTRTANIKKKKNSGRKKYYQNFDFLKVNQSKHLLCAYLAHLANS